MRALALFLLVAMFIATGIPVRAEQQWKTGTEQQQAFTAAVYTDDYARMVVSCRTSSYLSPEVSLTIVPPGKIDSQIASDGRTIFRTKEKEIQATLTRIGTPERTPLGDGMQLARPP